MCLNLNLCVFVGPGLQLCKHISVFKRFELLDDKVGFGLRWQQMPAACGLLFAHPTTYKHIRFELLNHTDTQPRQPHFASNVFPNANDLKFLGF